MIPLETVKAMYADYQKPMSLKAVGAKYGRDRRVVREMFIRRGLKVRPYKMTKLQRIGKNGCYLPAIPPTEAQVQQAIDSLRKMVIPPSLKLWWRKWPLKKRAKFVARLRARFPGVNQVPNLPYSNNVEPFDYSSARAHAIQARMNVGTNSRTKHTQIKVSSQGVIWRGKLFYWSPVDAHYYSGGGWREGAGRPAVHQLIWEEHNKKRVPRGMTVIHTDGNKNNLDPRSLALRSMAECLERNRAAFLIQEGRKHAAAALEKLYGAEKEN